MDTGELREALPELSNRLDELERERRRLAELTDAYRVVEKSKFARLRSLHAHAGALLRGNRREQKPFGATQLLPAASAAPATSNVNGFSPSGKITDVLERLIHELTLVRAAYLDVKIALESQRSRSAVLDPYRQWMQKFDPRETDLERMRELVPFLPLKPTFSILMPAYNTPERYLRAAIESVRAQVYPYWELCVADDASPDPSVRRVLEEYAGLDSRIRVTFREKNGHISRAMNSALEIATGEFVAFLDHDDQITPDALFECALIANRTPDVDMIYSDEDKIDEGGVRSSPFFKPDWNPDTFLSRMYTCHFGVYRRSLVEALGGLRSGFDGSQDYDLVLRLTERTTRVQHIPRILYHWRIHSASTASDGAVKPYAETAAIRAIGEALARRGEPGSVSPAPDAPGTYIVRYAIRKRDKVSIIIPTRNHGEDVDRCLKSIFAKTTYDHFEIVLLDNGSDDEASLQTFERWKIRDRRVKVVRYEAPFNFSRINNYAVQKSDGYYVLLLNNDTEVISADWMEAMVEQAQRPSIGAVGAFLLYPDGSVQHAGVITGIGGVAGHSHKYFPGNALGYFSTLRAINNYSAVTAACLMVRRSVFDQVGGFDEGLAVAFNDVDFCLKIRKAGYRNVCLPHVKLYHFESKSRGHEATPEQIRRFQGEIKVMEQRWSTRAVPDECYSRHLTLEHENFAIRTH
ncbi:MAG: glycosyltransferase family 2 protein [Candidatus Baltobacteraceae bacterium]|jgi:glycosyltransferase involved in cell wall biosynthesis